jgi:hypothetical protein
MTAEEERPRQATSRRNNLPLLSEVLNSTWARNFKIPTKECHKSGQVLVVLYIPPTLVHIDKYVSKNIICLHLKSKL